jgi:hypothetical protein
VAGPLIGLLVPVMTLLDRRFGISSSLTHACAAVAPTSAEFFNYDWWRVGGWNLVFVAGVFLGGVFSATVIPGSGDIAISAATREALTGIGIHDFHGLAPAEIFAWDRVGTVAGLVSMLLGGFLVAFGARVAGGCTSGHAISGMAELRLSSLVTVLGFFAGGLTITYFVLPRLLG